AAWREMARQIAHDIKNPLTPMRLSLDLLERARAERAANADQILERTLAMMRRQIDNLREIATDFYEFTGGRNPEPRSLRIEGLIDEVFQLLEAQAAELGVRLARAGAGGTLEADPAKLRRVLVNLVTNGLHAMRGRPGELVVRAEPDAGWMTIEVVDAGT